MNPAQAKNVVGVSSSRIALAGFFVSGFLLSFPGAILPAWGYHLRPNHSSIGNYFLAINAGLLISVRLARVFIRTQGLSGAAADGCVFAFIALLTLALTAPPVDELWRIPGFFILGLGAGLLNTALFHAISPAYRHDPAATVNLCGVFFGLGSLVVAVMIATTFNTYTVSSILVLVALVPGLFAMLFSLTRLPSEGNLRGRSLREVARELTVPSAVLFSLLLFCQFGNEWAIAGWLPLFLIQRLGLSPAAALLLLAAYWTALLTGRLTAQSALPHVHHGKLLFFSASAALFGCMMLTMTDNLFGAVMGVLLVGLGFAPIYPLVVEKIGARFPHYHPGFFNGIFSIGLTGGMLAPATLGYVGEFAGIGIVMALPAIGTFVVFLLVLAIWLESKLSGPAPKG